MSCVRYFLCIWFKWKITGILPVLWNISNFSPGKNWSYIKKWFKLYLKVEWPKALIDYSYKASSASLVETDACRRAHRLWLSRTVFGISDHHPVYQSLSSDFILTIGPTPQWFWFGISIHRLKSIFRCVSGQLKLSSFYHIYFCSLFLWLIVL